MVEYGQVEKVVQVEKAGMVETGQIVKDVESKQSRRPVQVVKSVKSVQGVSRQRA